MLFLDPKTDVAFKKLFGNQSKIDITISFLNSILGRSGKEEIVSATIGDPYNHPDTTASKLSIVDVRCTDQQGKQYIIEMQLLNRGDYKERCQYYVAHALAAQLPEGAPYRNLKPVIFVGITNFELFDDELDYLNHYYMLNDKTHKQGFLHIEIHLIELTKFHKTLDEVKTIADKWIFLLKEAQGLREIPRELASNDAVKKAFGILERAQWSTKDLEAYRKALDYKISEEAILEKAVEQGLAQGIEQGIQKGMEQGLAQGRAQGIEQGEKKKSLEIARSLIGVLTSKEIAKSTGLTLEEIEQLKPEKN